MTRDVWKEIDELTANQESLRVEWQRIKDVMKNRTVEISGLTDQIKNSAAGIDLIMDEIRTLLND